MWREKLFCVRKFDVLHEQLLWMEKQAHHMVLPVGTRTWQPTELWQRTTWPAAKLNKCWQFVVVLSVWNTCGSKQYEAKGHHCDQRMTKGFQKDTKELQGDTKNSQRTQRESNGTPSDTKGTPRCPKRVPKVPLWGPQRASFEFLGGVYAKNDDIKKCLFFPRNNSSVEYAPKRIIIDSI